MKKKKTQIKTQPDMVQSVWITFSDGTLAGFMGKAAAFPGDTRKIRDIKFTEPKPLPRGCTLETVA